MMTGSDLLWIEEINQGTGYANELWLEPAIGNTVNSIQLYLYGALRANVICLFNHHHHLFELLPSGKRYSYIKTRTTRFINTFYPKAITVLNSELNTPPETHVNTNMQ